MITLPEMKCRNQLDDTAGTATYFGKDGEESLRGELQLLNA